MGVIKFTFIYFSNILNTLFDKEYSNNHFSA